MAPAATILESEEHGETVLKAGGQWVVVSAAELLDARGLVPAGDPGALAEAIVRLAGDRVAGARGLERVRALCAPETVAASLARIYDAAE